MEEVDDVLGFDPDNLTAEELEKLQNEVGVEDGDLDAELKGLGIDLDNDDMEAVADKIIEEQEVEISADTKEPQEETSAAPATTDSKTVLGEKKPGNANVNAFSSREEQLREKMKALQEEHARIKDSLKKAENEKLTGTHSESTENMKPSENVKPEEENIEQTETSKSRPFSEIKKSTDSKSISTKSPPARGKKRAVKVIVVGNSKCGKTSIINRYVKDVFSNEYKYTIGCDYSMKQVQVTPDTTVRLQLWDIAGQDRFIHLSRAFYKKSAGAILVCDVTRPATFEALKGWKKEIDKDLVAEAKRKGAKVPVIMIANKVDLLPDVSKSIQVGAEVQKLAEELQLDGWFIGSAKMDNNISEAMMFLLKKIVGAEKGETMITPTTDRHFQRSQSVVVSSNKTMSKKKKKKKKDKKAAYKSGTLDLRSKSRGLKGLKGKKDGECVLL
mmetsp:Transcript_7816/g.11789  ORF Transcript_7816/g.11789 Transcript_7816/m.11789 type:complete len:444 (+) Transcript_7816:41-1372(+)|eukprot:CAMPEP_0167756708 /NCGR_PEP_ID=MMETSP0110_2-20121227/9533_1 /TAXON_ID=629695 /ORGANISM="Gymnochlora sp., Strain CCMP2014" /LENGTH=443 /DNA_ID=CAMNT_0007642843 /DNA_START=19 /DNA_END=1350 /DNA_ORIENTATION=-